jgi:hypothetical protein
VTRSQSMTASRIHYRRSGGGSYGVCETYSRTPREVVTTTNRDEVTCRKCCASGFGPAGTHTHGGRTARKAVSAIKVHKVSGGLPNVVSKGTKLVTDCGVECWAEIEREEASTAQGDRIHYTGNPTKVTCLRCKS